MERASSAAPHTFVAPDFDVLYDSPMPGRARIAQPFEVRGVRHEFVGYSFGDFDRAAFMNNLKAVVEAGVEVIRDVPYSRYVFLGISRPRQHRAPELGRRVLRREGQRRPGHQRPPTGVPRARAIPPLQRQAHPARRVGHPITTAQTKPTCCGAEGFTVYSVPDARPPRGASSKLLASIGRTIARYENNPGRLFQSATTSSKDTWTQGPLAAQTAA